VDVFDADHTAIKKMFIGYDALCEGGATADAIKAYAQ
jgi:hypothetical protein